VSGTDRGAPERLGEVAIADAGRSGEAEVVAALQPFQGGEELKRRPRQLAGLQIEIVERLGCGESGGLQAGALVGRFARGDLFADQRGEQLVRRPALRLGGLQQLGRELAHSA